MFPFNTCISPFCHAISLQQGMTHLTLYNYLDNGNVVPDHLLCLTFLITFMITVLTTCMITVMILLIPIIR